jgi:C4-dicarboxylate transporter, DctM subunit
MTPTMIGIIGIAALFVLIFSKMPVGYLMAIIGMLGFASIVSLDAALSLMARDVFSVFSSYNLTVIPLFVFMGQIAFHSGISSRLFDAAYKFVGHIPGGWPLPPSGLCCLFRHMRFHQCHGRNHGCGNPAGDETV